ncbi:Cytochrome c oxidase subunit 8B, mitochondrial [Merluccius polli]|uniref:Cytochrome c oxidase subunit 8B, mitochondrial n=1 Tax=Merluccius polli TaxID=89951 RepID=A0AA47N6Z4_MERPO|nr:Cytochrome c oxidase subunit 8B, mitochondrial [Merluccius polli]
MPHSSLTYRLSVSTTRRVSIDEYRHLALRVWDVLTETPASSLPPPPPPGCCRRVTGVWVTRGQRSQRRLLSGFMLHCAVPPGDGATTHHEEPQPDPDPINSCIRSVTNLVQRANLSSKPAKHNISAGEQAIAMTVMLATILGPSSWILCHLEDYKKRE